MDVAQSAAMAAMWVTKRGCLIDSSGNLTPPSRNSDHEKQARTLLLRHYGRESNDAVWQQLRTWSTFQRLGTGKRNNPPMASGDVTPKDCERAHLRFSSSEHRPYYQIPASRLKDLTPIKPREGLDT